MARVDGDGSYQKLIRNAYGMNKPEETFKQNYKEYTIVNIDEIMPQLSLSFLRSGVYYWSNGNLVGLKIEYDGWTSRVYNYTYSYNIGFHSWYFDLYYEGNKNFGLSVRCAAKSLIFSHVSFPISPPNFLPVMLLTLSAPKGGEWEKAMRTGVIKS